MIETTIPLTLSLSIALGAYMVAGGLAGLTQPSLFADIMDGFQANAAVAYLGGIAAFGIGAAIVLAHNVWGDPLAIVVSLVGWVAAAEGLLLIAFPSALLGLSASLLRPGMARGFSLFTLILGLVLLLLGLTGRAGG